MQQADNVVPFRRPPMKIPLLEEGVFEFDGAVLGQDDEEDREAQVATLVVQSLEQDGTFHFAA